MSCATFPGLLYLVTASSCLRSLHPFPPPSGSSSFQQPLSNQRDREGKGDALRQVHLFGASLHSKILAPESSLPRSSMTTANRPKMFSSLASLVALPGGLVRNSLVHQCLQWKLPVRWDLNLRKITPAGVGNAFVRIRSGDELEVLAVRGPVRW